MFRNIGQMLTQPDIALRRALRLGPGPIGFDDSLFISGYVADEPQSTTLTQSHNRIQIINPAASRIILLPSAGIRSGETFIIINRSATYTATVQAADASAIDVISTGYIKITSLQDTPADNGDWHVSDVYEYSLLTTDILNYEAGDPPADIHMTRHNKQITIGFDFSNGSASKVGTGNPRTNDAFAARFRPTYTMYQGTSIRDNGVYQAGIMRVVSTGLLEWRKANISAAWTNAQPAEILAQGVGYTLF